ncbi:phage tail sheath family protein [Clostridium botulinum]|uniref:phage tail sheath family protein n=1 Tax=Clostridium botulinum TaxID=1491 RepID=UPI001FD64D84|nr:phage tail sheath family protein [Clostridium botulinum]MCJ8173230.1 phage tail sheath subtilisin-like domain-containing protein [Clostridium botulinum]
MATGVWNENNRPTIPGFYNRFKALAEKRIGTGIHGILAMPVKANWGPVNKVINIKDEKDLINKFGKDNTAYRLGRLALLGQPKELLLYRLTDGTEKVSSVMLKDTEDTDILKIEALYPTTRDFNITIRANIVDDIKKDLILYEATKQLYAFSELGGTIEEIAKSINENVENTWLKATKLDEGNGKLGNVANQTITGGNDGTTSITNEHYIKAMEILEGYKADGFCLDGVTDESLQNTVKAWVKRNKTKGNSIIAYLGIKDTDTIQQANTKSKEFNFKGIVNVGISGYYEGVKYTPTETACYIAGLATGKRLKESICNEKTIFEDVEPRLSKEEVENCLEAGTLVMVKEDDEVIVVDDVNTLKKYSEEQNETWGYIRGIKFMNAVDGDTALKRKEFIGKVPNEGTGRLALICALKQYFEVLEKEGVIEDFTVEIDEELQAKAKNDEVFWKWDAKYVNVMKRIYGTGYLR